jgi:hypothetical protein|uniref:Uncharacterized protein n=1 Tax=Populus trichocarpa TaxID=3694 RepID=A0A2K1Z8T7_POPTR
MLDWEYSRDGNRRFLQKSLTHGKTNTPNPKELNMFISCKKAMWSKLKRPSSCKSKFVALILEKLYQSLEYDCQEVGMV